MTVLRMSLADAAAALGVPVNTLRSRFKAGKIRGERDNQGKLWVWIDPAWQGSTSKASKPSKQVRNDGEIEALRSHVETLKDRLVQAEARATEWQQKAEAAQAESLDLWRRFTDKMMEREQPRSWLDRLLGR